MVKRSARRKRDYDTDLRRRRPDISLSRRSSDGLPGLDWYFLIGAARYAYAEKWNSGEIARQHHRVTAYINKKRHELVERVTAARDAISLDSAATEEFNEQVISDTKEPHYTPPPPPEILAEELVSEWESWPRLYDLIVQLPLSRDVFDPVFQGRYALSDAMRLEVLSDRDFQQLGGPVTFDRNLYVLRLATLGHQLVEVSDPHGRLESSVRQFLGLAMASDLIDVAGFFPEYKVRQVAVEIGMITVAEFAASGYCLPDVVDWSDEEFSTDDSGVIGALVVPKRNWVYLRSRYLDAPEYTTDAAKFRQSLHEIGFAFRSNDHRLLSAGEWLFCSYSGTNQALQMVQAMTTLEVLFGGKKSEKNLTELLATRCAYLLGGRQQQREKINAEVKELYDQRSRILHDGKRRLTDDTYLRHARNLCKRAVRRELRYLAVSELL